MTDTTVPTATASRRDTVAGWIVSGLVILFLLVDGAVKLVPIQPVYDTMRTLGWPTDTGLLRFLGVLTIVPSLLYAWRGAALIGAVLLTAYLGGAIATHVRVGDPLLTHIMFGVFLGLMLWGGLYLRDPRLRALLR